MTEAIKADFADYRRVKGRRVLQLIVEVPFEREREVLEALGFPDPVTGIPIAIAKLKIGPDKGSSPPVDPVGAPQGQGKVRHLSQDAALKCKEPAFQVWLADKASVKFDGGLSAEKRETATIMFLKGALDIQSRKELDTDPAKAKAWDSLLADFEYRDAVR